MNILVVDDDIQNAKMTSFLLEEAGYRVFRVHDPSNILQVIEQHNPDLILLDIMMPKMDGFEVCRQIRRNSDIPIIFLSARTYLQDRVMGLQIGGDDYLVKPFEPSELLARVEAVLRRRNADVLNTSTRLSQGNITLDPVEHKVLFTDGRVVELTPLEFRLLYYLMKNSGRILNVSQILTKVWGYDYEGESNLVAVYIRRLRTKVEEDPDHPRHVITVRNLGYKFEP
ncbi:MAG: response regulator transcription factor [Chloroflexus sp.]|jgi:DNA-binding response OmpR family regulator|uniref:response regulator transcription factor n=1 Tax=Chloroflexus sp. Y-396-1 TaxID=867845 RepID=UPI000490EE7D|nr:response regulator transcription factor [Chloroflexus sp. Y-396-1]MBO9312242.1 response regulator transcription factor [Chloroflexus sp.]MBO9315178.1 response regulator transcription factor [Chloroflexus sp.]MBO9317653.1 response regulator transcription factor [Chloroflexus sp.]MBO9337579.1 response regulator transcription factor [Chloroflexus sp.]MBO9373432.1 response regulator transcription factor [Chloroflexus sp.]